MTNDNAKSLLIAFAISVVGALGLTSCSENYRAKTLGREIQITLPADQKLVNVTWKDNNIWYLTRPRRTNEPVEKYSFREKSEYGIREGTVILIEH